MIIKPVELSRRLFIASFTPGRSSLFSLLTHFSTHLSSNSIRSQVNGNLFYELWGILNKMKDTWRINCLTNRNCIWMMMFSRYRILVQSKYRIFISVVFNTWQSRIEIRFLWIGTLTIEYYNLSRTSTSAECSRE